MRKLACVIVLLFFAGSAWAQDRESLVLGGVEIWIGMPEERVNSALQANALTRDKNGVVLSEQRPPYRPYGQVTTKNGKVNDISRQWLLDETPNSRTGFAAALYGAVMSLVGAKGAGCMVSAQTQDQPTINRKVIIMRCFGTGARRTLRISETQATFREQVVHDADILEEMEEIAAP